MSIRRLAARYFSAMFILHAAACADSTSDETLHPDDLLSGDGHEFEQETPGSKVSGALAALAEADENPILALETGGTCCPDGNCVCRGSAPTDSTVNGRGPFRTASYSSGFRNGWDFGGATIYYPTNAEPPFSGVVMCPGYTAARSSIADWGPFFASHGIVLMTIDTNSTLDQVPARAEALLDALQSLKAENARAGSPLRGKLSPDRYGLAGWSMGGGGTWIATADHPELRTAVTLAGHNATAGGGIISRGSRVPTLMLNGADDLTILGGLGQTEAAYAAIPSTTPKMMYVMRGSGHFSWGTPSTNSNASGRYVLAWEKTFLEGDTRYRKFLLERGPRASTFETNVR